MNRRHFIKSAAAYVLAASAPGLIGCQPRSQGRAVVNPSLRLPFPFGVASADPAPDSVTLWTQVEQYRIQTPPESNDTSIANGLPMVEIEVALDADFVTPVLRQSLMVDAGADFTLRIRVTDLTPATQYYYRFIDTQGAESRVGRTRTAPHNESTEAVPFAFVSCQDYQYAYYGAYREMLNDEITGEFEPQFILHLGDFIYETISNRRSDNPDADPGENGPATRRLPAFPDGGELGNDTQHALTLADYRHLYRHVLLDPDLQEARARWPFVQTWDDHEFTNDAWQSEANYRDAGENSSTDEPSQQRRVAASQAWSEYVPAHLDLAGLGEPARDFVATDVQNTSNFRVNADNLASNEDNLAAINAITLYRRLQFGQHVQLLLTDNRSYRSDHAIPEDISGNNPVFFQARYLLPESIVNELDEAETANGNDPDTLLVLGQLTLNPRRGRPAGTMLGRTQRTWWQDSILNRPATWQLWGNSVPLQSLRVDISRLLPSIPDVIVSSDTWDGYNSEREAMLAFCRDNELRNVVSLSGDVHAFVCGQVQDDRGLVQMHEFVCAGVSSIPQFRAVERLSRTGIPDDIAPTVRPLIAVDGETPTALNNLDTTLVRGAVAAQQRAADIGSATETPGNAENPTVSPNPGLSYIDTDANGYARVLATAEQLQVDLITINDARVDTGMIGPGKLRTTRFRLDRVGEPDQQLSAPEIDGVPNAPFDQPPV